MIPKIAQALNFIRDEVKQVLPQYFHTEEALTQLKEGDTYYSFDNEMMVILCVLKPGVYLLEAPNDPGSAGMISTAKDLSRMPLSAAPINHDDLTSLKALVIKGAKEFERQLLANQPKIIT